MKIRRMICGLLAVVIAASALSGCGSRKFKSAISGQLSIDCTSAEITEKYVHKGDKLYIEGRIRYSTYDDKQGQRRNVTEIWADNMEMLSPKSASQMPDSDSPAPVIE